MSVPLMERTNAGVTVELWHDGTTPSLRVIDACCHYGALREHEVALLHRNEVEWDAVRAALDPANRRTP